MRAAASVSRVAARFSRLRMRSSSAWRQRRRLARRVRRGWRDSGGEEEAFGAEIAQGFDQFFNALVETSAEFLKRASWPGAQLSA
jgi:hypothetical protein